MNSSRYPALLSPIMLMLLTAHIKLLVFAIYFIPDCSMTLLPTFLPKAMPSRMLLW